MGVRDFSPFMDILIFVVLMENIVHNFSEAVYRVVRKIPKGETLSYADVAERAGFRGAARAVGTLMKKNDDREIPCHRVIRGCGRIGAYNRGGEQAKAERLIQEGVLLKRRIVSGRVVWQVL